MHNKLPLFTLLLLVALAGHAQKNVLNAVWRDSTIVINGNPNDWDQPFRYYDSKAKIQYSVVNDASNLYISLKTMDDKAQMKILRTGMEVWLDTSGKKKEITVVRYPLPGDTKLEWIQDPSEPERSQLERPDLKRMKMDYALSEKRMKLTGFKNIPTTVMPVENSYGIEVAIGWDKDDVFTYELKLPFSTFYKEKLVAADTLKPLTIGVKVGSFDVPQQISNGSVTDPSASNTGLRNQGYGNQQAQGSQDMPMGKINDMALSLFVQMRMKLAYK
ncbi:MAG: hypothetical protein JWO03_599 [Bacteroidetes bacterium]|nr:hypothetical protein [Bacteroidota bacterium]